MANIAALSFIPTFHLHTERRSVSSHQGAGHLGVAILPGCFASGREDTIYVIIMLFMPIQIDCKMQ